MTNKEIAKTFQYLGNIMELHGENKFKIRSYHNAYIALRKLDRPLSEMDDSEIAGIKGVGKAITGKIRELLDSGRMETLEKYRSQTPEGVQEMLNISGFGPKKILMVWKELGAESIGELLYAVNENRLIELKGFGQKTQEDLRQKLEYYRKSKHKFHFATLEAEAEAILKALREKLPATSISLTGEMRRRCNVVNRIELLVGTNEDLEPILPLAGIKVNKQSENYFEGITTREFPVRIYMCKVEEFGSKLFRYTASKAFLEHFITTFPQQSFKELSQEKEVFTKVGLPYIAPELREQAWALELAREENLPKLIEKEDIKGVIHTHTTYSDGLHSLEDMVSHARSLGYDYIGITDHSQAAFYANGLKPDRVLEQMAAIDVLNQQMAPFRIFKGIESDILNDGSLDYEEDILKQFDFIIASVHSNLRMEEAKATQRIITAVENPYTSIMGHPTGRLLLSRKGYLLDHMKVIDACAANGVSIELNANPYRLDLDWSWIPYALEKGVMISINPDAHSKEGMKDIHFGVLSARKGGLTAAQCLNALDAEGFARAVKKNSM